jgi:hypothetical protein
LFNKIISLHIPKTAGTTFKKYMEASFQNNFLEIDSKPIIRRCEHSINTNYPVKLSDSKELFIHGHITFNDIIYSDNFYYITWLRDPVERVISHYNYFKIKPITSYTHPIELKIKNENLSLNDFIKIPCMQNIQSYYLNNTAEIDKFAFIGIVELFTESLMLLEKKLEKKFISENIQNQLVNNNKAFVSDKIRNEIRKVNQKDCELYDIALKNLKIELENV